VDILSFCNERLHRRGRQLSLRTRAEKELRPVAKEFRRPAFIRLNMGGVVGNNAVLRLTKRSQREGIGCRSVENEKNFALGFKVGSKKITSFFCVAIHAVRCLKAFISFPYGRPSFRTNSCSVVARKLVLGLDLPQRDGGRMGGTAGCVLHAFKKYAWVFLSRRTIAFPQQISDLVRTPILSRSPDGFARGNSQSTRITVGGELQSETFIVRSEK